MQSLQTGYDFGQVTITQDRTSTMLLFSASVRMKRT